LKLLTICGFAGISYFQKKRPHIGAVHNIEITFN